MPHTDEPREHYTPWKKANRKGHTVYESIYTKCPRSTKAQRQEVVLGLPRTGGVWGGGGSYLGEMFLKLTVVMVARPQDIVETTELHTLTG